MKKMLPQSCFSRAVPAGAARRSALASQVLIPGFIKYKAIPRQRGCCLPDSKAAEHSQPPLGPRAAGCLGPALCLGGSVL